MVETTDSVKLFLKRHKKGIEVRVNVIPEVEDFFRQWGGGIVTAPTHGRLWKSATDNQRLELWSFEGNLKSEEPFDVVSTGAPLITDRNLVNISFLRLVGASQPEGRTFIIEQVVSNPELRLIGQRIVKSAERFYVDYIQHVKLKVFVGVVDLSRMPQQPPAAPTQP